MDDYYNKKFTHVLKNTLKFLPMLDQNIKTFTNNNNYKSYKKLMQDLGNVHSIIINNLYKPIYEKMDASFNIYLNNNSSNINNIIYNNVFKKHDFLNKLKKKLNNLKNSESENFLNKCKTINEYFNFKDDNVQPLSYQTFLRKQYSDTDDNNNIYDIVVKRQHYLVPLVICFYFTYIFLTCIAYLDPNVHKQHLSNIYETLYDFYHNFNIKKNENGELVHVKRIDRIIKSFFYPCQLSNIITDYLYYETFSSIYKHFNEKYAFSLSNDSKGELGIKIFINMIFYGLVCTLILPIGLFIGSIVVRAGILIYFGVMGTFKGPWRIMHIFCNHFFNKYINDFEVINKKPKENIKYSLDKINKNLIGRQLDLFTESVYDSDITKKSENDYNYSYSNNYNNNNLKENIYKVGEFFTYFIHNLILVPIGFGFSMLYALYPSFNILSVIDIHDDGVKKMFGKSLVIWGIIVCILLGLTTILKPSSKTDKKYLSEIQSIISKSKDPNILKTYNNISTRMYKSNILLFTILFLIQVGIRFKSFRYFIKYWCMFWKKFEMYRLKISNYIKYKFSFHLFKDFFKYIKVNAKYLLLFIIMSLFFVTLISLQIKQPTNG